MLSKLVRIGKDAELRWTPSGTPVINLTCVYNIGYGDKQKAQWIDCSIWGKQAEALEKYLTKGSQIVIHADDVEVETYEGKNGMGAKLKCRVINLELAGSKQAQQQPQPQKPTKEQEEFFADDFEDSEIPF